MSQNLRPWTDAEQAIIRRHYRTWPIERILGALPGRSLNAIRHVAKRLGVKTVRFWTAADEATLRAGWGVRRCRDLARELDRTPGAVKQQATRLGLDSQRIWTVADKALLRELYPTHTAAAIAERLHGTRRAALAVYRMAAALGLRKCPHHSPEEMERVRAALSTREPLTDVAAAIRLGLTREQVTHIRNRLGIPRNEEAIKAAGRRAVAKQYATLGVKNRGELRALAYRRYARENGWPEDLPPRCVQILNVLAEHGPKTRHELAEAIGMRTDRMGCNGRPCQLKASAHSALMKGHGSYTGLLLSRGFVIEQRRSGGAGAGTRGGRLPSLYLLTPAAIAIREECLARQRDAPRVERNQRPGQTALPHSDAGGSAGEDAARRGDRRMGGGTPGRRV